tara:strand:- start:1 stop:273 length:273 start_codon:yes stop_codon:yes gene_type:complete
MKVNNPVNDIVNNEFLVVRSSSEPYNYVTLKDSDSVKVSLSHKKEGYDEVVLTLKLRPTDKGYPKWVFLSGGKSISHEYQAENFNWLSKL